MRLAVIWLLCACATANELVPPEQRAGLKRELEGEERYLKLSFYSTPFFGDAARKLLTPVPPAQVRLVESPDGSPLDPGEIERTFPAGTAVRIKHLEFPTARAQLE